MTDEQFDALVARLEEPARRDPQKYQLKVLGLALLGNLYVYAVLLLLVAACAWLVVLLATVPYVAVKLLIVLVPLLFMIVKALWVSVPLPEGIEVDARSAPQLFATIAKLQHALRAPAFHRVLITHEFNAAVLQVPRLGLFGWTRNYLLIGLPLMKSLSVEQLEAVLAHEFGHLAKGHGRVSNWLYRQRLRWMRLIAALTGSGSSGGILFAPFFNRFAPYFAAYSFPLARANEYEADAAAARLTSAPALAEALTNVSVVGTYLAERYWPELFSKADDAPRPVGAAFADIGARVAAEVDDAAMLTWLEREMARRQGSADTHPPLSRRLEAIGASPRVALPREDERADRLLEPALQTITEALDTRWQAGILPAWEERHRAVQEARSRLADLNARRDELGLDEACERARLTGAVGADEEGAVALLRELMERHPDSAVVCFSLGSRLLARGDDEGCALLERAMALEDEGRLAVCALLRDYQAQQGRAAEARAWNQRLVERYALEQAANAERSRIGWRARLEPHGLRAEELAKLQAALRAVPKLRKAYFARKQVTHLPRRPAYVLGFEVTAWYCFHVRRRATKVQQALQQNVAFPGHTLIVNLDVGQRRLRSTLGRVPESRIV